MINAESVLPHVINSQPAPVGQDAAIKMLVLVDGDWVRANKANINDALRKLAEDYESATDGEVTIRRQVEVAPFPFDDLRWRQYGPYPNGSYLQAPDRPALAALIASAGPFAAHCLTLVIHETNWREPKAGGYEMGVWFSDDGKYSANNGDYPYRVQFIRANERTSARRVHGVMSMELAHSLDDFARRVGIKVTDKFDYDVIHDPIRRARAYQGVIAWLHGLGMFEKAFPVEEEEKEPEQPHSLEDRVTALEGGLESLDARIDDLEKSD